jgi:hypothetical protein
MAPGCGDRRFGTGPGWDESRGIADWVIVTDIDEHLYHLDLYNYLAQCRIRGVVFLVPALGRLSSGLL